MNKGSANGKFLGNKNAFQRMRTAHSSSHGGDLHQCMLGYTPLGVGLETPPGCGPGDPPRHGPGDPHRPDPSSSPLDVDLKTPQIRPLNFPLGMGLETCKACLDTTPPLETCCKACLDTTCNACWDTVRPSPPVNRITDV